MFYEVRVLNPKGKVEKVIGEKELSKQYWKGINEASPTTGRRGKPGRKSKRKSS